MIGYCYIGILTLKAIHFNPSIWVSALTWWSANANFCSPAILRSRIFRHNASAFRFGQFSNFCEKLLKNLYSRMVMDMRRCILASFGSAVLKTTNKSDYFERK